MIEVIHSVSRMDRAGQETLLMNLMRNIDRTEVHFSFLCTDSIEGDYDAEIRSLGGEIYHLGKCFLHKLGYLRYLGDIWKNYVFFRSHSKIDILHIHNYHAFTVFLQVLGAKLGGCKRVIVHSHNSSAPHARLHHFFARLLPIFRFERYACSELAAEWMYGSRANRAYIVNNGLIPESFRFNEHKRLKVRNELNLTNQQFVIGHIGRFNYQKNHSQLLKIFKEIYYQDNSACLLLVGRGELEDGIRDEINKLNLDNSVLLLGVREDIPELLSAFDLFLFPSLFEGLPVTLIEAQAAGLPCVISDTISSEAMISSEINSCSLGASPLKWAEEVMEFRNFKRPDNTLLIKENGYDIRLIAKDLTARYVFLLKD